MARVPFGHSRSPAGQRAFFGLRDILSIPTWALRLEGDTITGVSDGAALATWTGAIGSATQATGGAQPLYRASSTGLPGSLTAVEFDGTDDFLTSTVSASAAMTVFVVARVDVWKSQGGVFVSGSANGSTQFSARDLGAGLRIETQGTGTVGSYISGALPTGTWRVYGAKYANPGAWTISLDGVTVASGTSALTTSASLTRRIAAVRDAAAVRMFDGKMAAVFQADSALPDADFVAIGQALVTKYLP